MAGLALFHLKYYSNLFNSVTTTVTQTINLEKTTTNVVPTIHNTHFRMKAGLTCLTQFRKTGSQHVNLHDNAVCTGPFTIADCIRTKPVLEGKFGAIHFKQA